MAFITISKPAVGDPTTKDLEDDIIDNQVFLNNNIAASIGGLIINYSFETDVDSDGEADGWAYTNYTGGSNALEQNNESGGVNSQSFTSTVANGGGYITSLDYFEVGGDEVYRFSVWRHASVANVSCQYQVTWYTDAKVSISTTTCFQDTNTPTARSLRGGVVQAPTTARYAKVRLMGGVPAVGSATGTIYFDRVYFDRVSTGWQTKSITEFSSDANIELDISNNNHHLIVFSGVHPSAAAQTLISEISLDNGSTWKNGGNNYNTNSGLATNIVMTANTVTNAGGAAPLAGSVKIYKHSNGRSRIEWSFTWGDGGIYATNAGSGWYTVNTLLITNIRFDVGTFASGRCLHLAMD